MKRLLPLISLFSLLWVRPSASADQAPASLPPALTNWTELANAADISAVAYGNGSYFAATVFGTLQTSTDASNWEHPLLGNAVPGVQSLVYAQGQWVSVGYANQIHTSTDGRAWTRLSGLGNDTYLSSITFGNGLFVAVGGGSEPRTRAILISTNATNWIVRDFSLNQGTLWKVSYAQRQFVAVGNFGTLMTSGDARNWRVITNLTGDRLSGIAHGKDQTIVVGSGGIFSSTNGFDWRTNRLGPINYFDVAYGADRFVATGNGSSVWASTNGLNWTAIETGSPAFLNVITYEAGRFIAGGAGGTLAVSTNGLDWEIHTSGSPQNISSLAVSPVRMVALGSGALFTSADGASWQTISSLSRYQFYNVHFAGGQFIAFGLDRSTTSREIVATSLDGLAWRLKRQTPPSTPERIVFGNGLYVGARDHFFASPDGTNWTNTAAPQYGPILGLAFGKNKFVAVRNARVYTSTNGTNWSTNLVTGFELVDVAYGNNTFAAVGFHDVGGPNITAVSSDGINWTTNSLPREPDGNRYVRLTFGGGWFVAYGPPGKILASRDGVNWIPHHTGARTSFSSIAYDRGRFIAVGYPGVVLESGSFPILDIGASAGAGLRLRVGGMPNEIFAIEATASLTNPVWQEVGRVTNSAAETVFEDAMRSDPRRFYRLVAPGD